MATNAAGDVAPPLSVVPAHSVPEELGDMDTGGPSMLAVLLSAPPARVAGTNHVGVSRDASPGNRAAKDSGTPLLSVENR